MDKRNRIGGRIMRNLDKVWSIWVDLDASYRKGNYKETKIDFLRKLVSNGNTKEVLALLAKIASDIENAEDNKKYKYIQESILAVINNYDFLSDSVDSLNNYIVSLVEGNIKKNNLTFEEFLVTVLPYTALELEQVDFSLSNVGGEYITAKEVHKINLCSESALIAPKWMKNNINSVIPIGDFGEKALDVLKHLDEEKSYPVALVDKNLDLSNKTVIRDENEKMCLVCGEVSMAVKII